MSNMRSTAFIRFTVFPGRFSPPKQHHQQNLLAVWLRLDLYATSNNSNLIVKPQRSISYIITVGGSIEVRGPYSEVSINVIDPEGKIVESVQVEATSANEFTQFTHSFVAGENEGKPDYEEPMVTSGYYLMVVQFGPERVVFIFEYTATSGATTGATTTEATTGDNSTSSTGALNVTAINQLTAQAITHTEQAYIAMQNNNDTQGVFRNLNLALNELESVLGNLTLTAPDGGRSSSNIGNNTAAETTTGAAVTSRGGSSSSGNGGGNTTT